MKKTILYVITQGEWGGAQRYVFDLAMNLSDDFDVITAVGEPNGKKDLQNKILNYKSEIQIIQLKHLKRKILPFHDILAVFELAKLYKTIKPDIIHLNSSKAGIIGSFARLIVKLDSRFRGNDKMRVIYTVHGWVFNEPTRKLGRWLYRLLEKWTAKIKDKIIVLSESDYQDGLDSCFRSPRCSFGEAGRNDKVGKKKLVKIPLGIELPMFLDKQTARESLSKISNFKFQISNFAIGTIANLYPSKGLDVLIEAIKILSLRAKQSNPPETEIVSSHTAPRNDIQFIIIGEGAERKKLQLLINNYQLQNVHLLGAIDNAAQYLKAFDLFVLPSRKEGLPYTILEAIAAEIPIVATNVGGVAELIKNTMPPDNPVKLAEAIIAALNNPLTNKKNALTVEKMIEETKKIYYNQ